MKIELGLATSGIARDYFHRVFVSHYCYFFLTCLLRRWSSANVYIRRGISIPKFHYQVRLTTLNHSL